MNIDSKVNSERHKLLLVIEDKPFWRELLRLEVNKELPGAEIDMAIQGSEAIEKIKSKKKFDAIIIDIKLPDRNGIEVIRYIRGMLYQGPIIVWSAHKYAKESVQAIFKGPVDGFCVKESNISHLITMLKNAWDNDEHQPDEALFPLTLPLH